MKKIASLTGVLLVLMASASFAQTPGVNLAWDNCFSAGGTADKNIACAATTADQLLYGSVIFGQDITPVTVDNLVVMQTADAALGTFWSGAARIGGTLAAGARTTVPGCHDWSSGDPAPADNFVRTASGNRIRLRIGFFIAFGQGHLIPAGTEIGAFGVAVKTNAGADATCEQPACFVFNTSTMEDQDTFEAVTVSNPAVRQHATWKGATLPPTFCPQATPTARKTWGAIKAIYR